MGYMFDNQRDEQNIDHNYMLRIIQVTMFFGMVVLVFKLLARIGGENRKQ